MPQAPSAPATLTPAEELARRPMSDGLTRLLCYALRTATTNSADDLARALSRRVAAIEDEDLRALMLARRAALRRQPEGQRP